MGSPALFWVCICSRFALVLGLLLILDFISCFSRFDGDWIWLLDLDLGFARDWFGASWTWEEHEEYFLLVFNLIFSSFYLFSSNMGLSSW